MLNFGEKRFAKAGLRPGVEGGSLVQFCVGELMEDDRESPKPGSCVPKDVLRGSPPGRICVELGVPPSGFLRPEEPVFVLRE